MPIPCVAYDRKHQVTFCNIHYTLSVLLAQLVKSLAAPTHVHSCVQEVWVQSLEQTIMTQDSIPLG